VVATAGFISSFLNFRGYYRFVHFITRFLPDNLLAEIAIDKDSVFLFYIKDPYWIRLICSRYSYESEIEHVLKKLKDIDFTFIDIGANFGYWSVKISGDDLGNHLAIAVEPMPIPYSVLLMNNSANSNRFHTIQAAIHSENNLSVSMVSDANNVLSNVGAHMSSDPMADGNIISVQSTTIDTISQDFKLFDKRLVVKIDVEGAEIAALEGMTSSLYSDFLLLYEDHGKDRNATINEYLLSKGYKIFSISQKRINKIDNIEQVFTIKQNPKKGYNFCAILPSSSFYPLLSDPNN
jgi:FkbM family methyltransferase